MFNFDRGLSYGMSSDSESPPTDGEQDGQPNLSDFIERTCPVCGRTYDEDQALCHPSHIVTFERRLATQDWLFSGRRPPGTPPHKSPVVGSDRVTFEPLYLALRSLIQSESARFDEYITDTPYAIQQQDWLSEVFRQSLSERGELVPGVVAGIRASEDRLSQNGVEATPAEVFAHVVWLDQFGLLPGYDALRHGTTRSLREICAEHYGVQPNAVDSEWVIKRRVDRSKVYTTTPEFRRVKGLELVRDNSGNASHPHADCKPFDGAAILDDHRDHNLVARRAKAELRRLPNVDWTVSPHIIYSRSNYGSAEDSPSNLPILGFDVAGFKYTSDGQRLRYLGVVTDWEESLFETYLQAVQLGKTAATGVLILPNREWIYDFLHFLTRNDLTQVSGVFPESRDRYQSIPNVEALHTQLISKIPLFASTALLPRRKFLDEGFETLDDLVSVPTYD